eukprot:INCI9920.3.p1 GENE.INCI9920.3~~INCI9920.3.p1  ORF type:complete len:597 (+),score=108.55 INCI9920.3:149-1792(+)
MSEEAFMSHYFKKKALVIPGPASRFRGVIERSLDGLRLESLLDATPTEEIHCWMPTRDRGGLAVNANDDNASGATSQLNAQATVLQSFQVGSTKHALSVHRAGGSLYFRAPDELAERLIPALTGDLGMGRGAFYHTGGGGGGPNDNGDIRGEIETFVSRKGHLTDWHFDFMENFTLQLAGQKTWRFKRTNAPHPLRGCTPHFADASIIEQQLKVHRLTKRDFEFAVPQGAGLQGAHDGDTSAASPASASVSAGGSQMATNDDSADDYVEVILKAGDFMYFPAGMWHRVECTGEGEGHTPCISINLSLFSAPWADTAADAVRQLLWRHDRWRSGMALDNDTRAQRHPQHEDNAGLTPKHTYGRAHMEQLLADLKQTVAALSVDDLFPEHVVGQPDSRLFRRQTRMTLRDVADGHTGSSSASSNAYRRNPLSVMFAAVGGEDNSVDSDSEDADDEGPKSESEATQFVVHFNFGNEELRSAARVHLTLPVRMAPLVSFLANKLELEKLVTAAALMQLVPELTSNLSITDVTGLLKLLHRASFLSMGSLPH